MLTGRAASVFLLSQNIPCSIRDLGSLRACHLLDGSKESYRTRNFAKKIGPDKALFIQQRNKAFNEPGYFGRFGISANTAVEEKIRQHTEKAEEKAVTFFRKLDRPYRY